MKVQGESAKVLIMDYRKKDRVGWRGQSIFKAWAEESDLLPQPPEHDRLGWDFFLEFQPSIVPGTPLDRQHDLKKALVQVKSAVNFGPSVRGKLSAFKHLVDTDLPAFIACLELRDGQPVRRARLLHVGRREIEIILKRIREIEASGRSDLHNVRISLSLSPATELNIDGSNLSAAILQHIGSNSTNYVRRKAQYRRTCGYGSHSHIVNLRWKSANDGREIVDLALGYLPKLDLDEAVVKRTRFGIELDKDVKRIFGGTLRIEPKAVRVETISVRNENLEAYLGLELFSPGIPNLPTEHRYVRLKNDFLDAKLHFGESNLKINFNLPYSGKHRIDLLARLLKFLYALSIKGSVLSIGTHKSVLSERIEEPFSDFATLRELWEFTEYLSLTLFRYRPDNEVRTNLDELGKLYWGRIGLFSLVSAMAGKGDMRISGVAAWSKDHTEMVLYFPVVLRFFGYCLGCVVQIGGRGLEFREGWLSISNTSIQNCYETFFANKDITDAKTHIAQKVREIANAHGNDDSHRFVGYVSDNGDGTYDIINQPRTTALEHRV